MHNQNTLPETGFMRLPEVLKFIPVGKSTWWAKVKSGEYPKPYKLGKNTSAWRVEDIRALINSFTAQ
jgi:predicted DNA-binding transcriptional regulator AlpA